MRPARLVDGAEHLVGLLAGGPAEQGGDGFREPTDLPHEYVAADHGGRGEEVRGEGAARSAPEAAAPRGRPPRDGGMDTLRGFVVPEARRYKKTARP